MLIQCQSKLELCDSQGAIAHKFVLNCENMLLVHCEQLANTGTECLDVDPYGGVFARLSIRPVVVLHLVAAHVYFAILLLLLSTLVRQLERQFAVDATILAQE